MSSKGSTRRAKALPEPWKPYSGLPEPVPQEPAESLLAWVAEGKPLRAWCRQAGRPCPRTVENWLNKDPTFAAAYRAARELGAGAIAEECLAIADTPGDHEDDVAHRKLRVHTRLQLLAKWFPQLYGDRQHVEHSGEVTHRLTAEQARAKSLELLERARQRRLGENGHDG